MVVSRDGELSKILYHVHIIWVDRNSYIGKYCPVCVNILTTSYSYTRVIAIDPLYGRESISNYVTRCHVKSCLGRPSIY